MTDFIKSSALLLVLLNPFLVVLYLVDVVKKLERGKFAAVLIRAGVISSVVQAKFASFQIFGGAVFLLIALQFVFRGPTAIEILRGQSEHLAGAIAMPVLIGPGTISASVIIGKRLDPLSACAAVLVAVFLFVVVMIALKAAHDFVRPHRGPLIQRYIEIAGRIMALYVGTVSVDMIMQGIRSWAEKF